MKERVLNAIYEKLEADPENKNLQRQIILINKAILNDPAKGTYSVSMETFDKSFTGICLLFEPSESFQPGGKPKSVIQFAKSRLKGTGSVVAFVILTTIISSLLGIIRPAF